MNTPGFLSALGRDHTLRPELLPDVGVVPLAVKLDVGQHQPDARLLGSSFDYCGQTRSNVPRASSRDLRQQKLLIQIRHDHPLQPMSPRQRFLPMMMHASHKERADRSLRQARGIDRHAGTLASPSAWRNSRCPQPHFSFAKGPVLVTHQAEGSRQLRLRELVFAESASVVREHRLGDLQGDASKGQESDFGPRTSCLDRKQQFQSARYLEFSLS
jgi:hypothetical protein